MGFQTPITSRISKIIVKITEMINKTRKRFDVAPGMKWQTRGIKPRLTIAENISESASCSVKYNMQYRTKKNMPVLTNPKFSTSSKILLNIILSERQLIKAAINKDIRWKSNPLMQKKETFWLLNRNVCIKYVPNAVKIRQNR